MNVFQVFCRWSDDWHRSDVYVFTSERGFEVHVCERRLMNEIPESVVPSEPPQTKEEAQQYVRKWEQWFFTEREHGKFHVRWVKLRTLSSEFGNRSFIVLTPDACIELLNRMAAAGINVPEHAFTDLAQIQNQPTTQRA